MGFDAKGFMKAQFEARTEDVPVSELKDWFPDGEAAVFTVKGLTFEELSKADAAADNSGAMLKLLASIQNKNGGDIGEGIKDAFGVGKETPVNMIKRINHLVMGCVCPEVDEEFAVKLANTFPVEFTAITNKIIELTGRGYVPGKQKSSTRSKKSEQA
ncbi:MAG: hypothetical protein R3204_15365 [Oceanospirillum sp.]|nr:hypothetical protein [Oceanospirillum sp.]